LRRIKKMSLVKTEPKLGKGTVIRPCSCKSKFQDEVYGKGLRVKNCCPKSDKNSSSEPRCTVCGTR